MKIKEIIEKDNGAIEQALKEKQRHLFDLRTQMVTEKLEDPTQIRKTRKDIARMKTVLRQRQLEQQRQATAQATAQAK